MSKPRDEMTTERARIDGILKSNESTWDKIQGLNKFIVSKEPHQREGYLKFMNAYFKEGESARTVKSFVNLLNQKEKLKSEYRQQQIKESGLGGPSGMHTTTEIMSHGDQYDPKINRGTNERAIQYMQNLTQCMTKLNDYLSSFNGKETEGITKLKACILAGDEDVNVAQQYISKLVKPSASNLGAQLAVVVQNIKDRDVVNANRLLDTMINIPDASVRQRPGVRP